MIAERGTRVLNNVQAINEALDLALAKDERVVLFGEDVGTMGGVFRASDGLAQKYGEKRVFDTPLAESGIVGFGIGLAMAGLRPVAEIQFAGFLPRPRPDSFAPGPDAPPHPGPLYHPHGHPRPLRRRGQNP